MSRPLFRRRTFGRPMLVLRATRRRVVIASVSATVLTLFAACGGEDAASSSDVAPDTTATTTASAMGGATAMGGASAMGGADFDPNAPEYQGDHSLPGDPVAGEEVYRASCLACHAADGKGNGGITGANLVDDRRRLAKNNDTLLHSIREGVLTTSPAMPPHKDILTEVQIRDALSYVRRTFGGTQE
jgi:mono/diheme cytochrome c family protein